MRRNLVVRYIRQVLLGFCVFSSLPAKILAAPISLQQRQPVIIAMGGFNSCRRDLSRADEQKHWWNLMEYRQQIESAYGREPRWIFSCFASSNASVTMYNSWEDRGNSIESLGSGIQKIKSLLATRNDYAVFLVGHSYGGWFAIKTAMALQGLVPVVNLASIDPISTKLCIPSSMKRVIIRSLFGRGELTDPECTRAPQDLIEDAAARPPTFYHWQNFYQVQARNLHSGPMEVANENIRISGDANDNSTGTSMHVAIGGVELVWDAIFGKSLATISENPSL